MHNMQNMQFNTICKIICNKICSKMQVFLILLYLTRISKICKIICKICIICKTDFNMQNMHCPLCWCGAQAAEIQFWGSSCLPGAYHKCIKYSVPARLANQHQQIGVLLWHIMTFSIFYIHYDTIMTLLLPLLLLQKSDHYCTLWQNPGKHYYFTYDSSIIAIITSRHYYCYYCYYDTIMAIMVIWRTYDTYDNPGLLLALF
jgi:hypothetical protein